MNLIEFSERLKDDLSGNEIILERKLNLDSMRKVDDFGKVEFTEIPTSWVTISVAIHTLYDMYSDILEDRQGRKLDRMIGKKFYDPAGMEIDKGYVKYLLGWQKEGVTFD